MNVLMLVLVFVIVLMIMRAYKKTAPKRKKISEVGSSSSMYFLCDQSLQQESITISTEDIPLDNRFGSSVLMSEHEFIQEATSSLKIDRNRESSGRFKIGWALIESELNGQISRSLGIDIGNQITRRVSLKFEAAAGESVLYRVAWKQNFRKGLAELDAGNQVVQVPYEIIYGLYHSVESLSTKK